MTLLHILSKIAEALKRDKPKLPPSQVPSLLLLWMNSASTHGNPSILCSYPITFPPPILGYCLTKFSFLSCINFYLTIGSFPLSFKHYCNTSLKKTFLDSILSSTYHSIVLIIFTTKSLHFWAQLLFQSFLNSLPPLHLSRCCMSSILLVSALILLYQTAVPDIVVHATS